MYSTYAFANLLFLCPLYILVLYMGFQQWRRGHSVGSRTAASHSDFFTYHMAILEIFCVFGSVLYVLSIFINNESLFMLGVYAFNIIFPGQSLFHSLTCVERYLAVVHPVTYMHLREARGVMIRNSSIAFVWLMCFGWIGLTALYMPEFPSIPLLFMSGVCVIVVLFCCVSVLHILNHPGPGEVGGKKEHVDQSKQRAFHMLVAIAGALLLRFVGLFICFGFVYLVSGNIKYLCWVMDLGIILTVPSSLVLPLLYLHRARKLACCRHNTESK